MSKSNGGTGVKDFMDGMGLGMLVEQVNGLYTSGTCYCDYSHDKACIKRMML